jgi:hypothetical protein
VTLSRRSVIAGIASAPLTMAVAPGGGETMPNKEPEIVELRQYTLRGGQRDTLTRLFEGAFIAPQEAAGARVLGTYRDLDDADRFVWLRGFDDMVQRGMALRAFYGGSVWQAHRTEANATMIDSDNVLLLRRRAGSVGALAPQGLVTVWIHYLGKTAPDAFGRFFEDRLTTLLVADGAIPIWTLETEAAPNSFPPLPVREGERVFVWFARWPDRAALDRFDRLWRARSGWRDTVPADLLPALMRKPERLLLAPTAAASGL